MLDKDLPAPATLSTGAPQTLGFAQQMSTRFAFLITGLAMSAWAPLIPFVKARLAIGESTLGLLILCFGVGSLLAMPVTGLLVNRYGCRRVITSSLLLMCLSLVCLAIAPGVRGMAVNLLIFGMMLGATDVAMNMQAVVVEKASVRAMMSGFHGFYSLGGIFGAVVMSALLWLGLSPFHALLSLTSVLLLMLAYCAKDLLPKSNNDNNPDNISGEREPFFVLPRGKVLLLGSLCFIAFLSEGAVLDWSAVFLNSVREIDPVLAGLGYACFSVAMTIGRFTGDKIVNSLGGTRVVLWGGLCAATGFLLVVFVPFTAVAFIGFTLIGVGASNIVPVLFTAAGNQDSMPMGLAISAVVSMGYAGLLAGPAVIGFIAELSSLNVSFGIVALGLLALAASAKKATSK
ncbi:MFS transporter [Cellvibrio fibrivorans]|uniref:MFS family arabinose efflux permease n=1 Tax=Cellvibrio fibrivorans TaxID=126350 RepID=A0ABU1UY07_9GAMM|nr:MFS transporter [Cellvibrio fibrivorans]MDR7089983.1 putative MFS family arabinose efflux permease [Cellvibrio fibrivorans]